jgi:hypothetical protein
MTPREIIPITIKIFITLVTEKRGPRILKHKIQLVQFYLRGDKRLIKSADVSLRVDS